MANEREGGRERELEVIERGSKRERGRERKRLTSQLICTIKLVCYLYVRMCV